jgi:type II secretory pathway pseudopilin PulG
MRIEDILHSTVALDRIQKQKQAESKSITLRTLRSSQDEAALLRQTDEQLIGIRDRQQSYMRQEIIVSGLELLKKKVDELSRTPVEERNYDEFSKQLQQIVSQTRFQGETPLGYLSLKITDEKSLYTLNQQIDQEIIVHQSRLRQDRKQLAAFLVTSENRDALASVSPEKLANTIKETLYPTADYPLRKEHSFAQILKIL